MAKKSGSETGLVITLIVFILLAIAGIGFAVHFYHQMQLSNSAMAENQSDFQQYVGEAFRHAGWDLPSATMPEYGIVYSSDAYAEVAEKLTLAATYEDLQPMLPWENDGQVAEALERYTPEGESFQRVEGLLGFYQSRSESLRRQVGELERNLRETEARRVAERDAFRNNMDSLRSDYRELQSEHRDRLQELRRQYSQMEARWEEAIKDTWPSFEQLRREARDAAGKARQAQEAREDMEAKVEELQQKLVPPERPDKFFPEGLVIAAERGHDEIMLEGGEDAGRYRGEEVIIYYAPGEDPVYVASAVVTRVFESASMARLSESEIPVLEGQMYVRKWQWEEREPDQPVVRPDEIAEWNMRR